MQIWNYHPVTKELVGSSEADEHPLVPGEWLQPAFSTHEAPPERRDGHAVVFANGWSNVPDHRGENWWLADATDNAKPQRVTEIGDPTTFDPPLTNAEPPAPPAIVLPIVVSPRQIRQALNLLGLRASVEAWVQAADQDTRDNWQYATEFVRDNNLVEVAATDLGKTPEEVDELFALAKAL